MNTLPPDPLGAKRSRRKLARPAELLAAALDVLVEKGYAATRVDEVARRAGVSKGTLFLYFPSKEALFQAVVRDNAVRLQTEGAQEMAAFEGTSAEMLLEFMLQWWRRYGTTRASGLTQLIMSESANFPELAQFFYAEVVAPGHAMLVGLLQRGVARGEFAVHCTPLAVHAILSPLLYLVSWKHSMAAIAPAEHHIDPETFIRHHAALLVRGFSESP